MGSMKKSWEGMLTYCTSTLQLNLSGAKNKFAVLPETYFNTTLQSMAVPKKLKALEKVHTSVCKCFTEHIE